VETGIQACPCENREPVLKDHGFTASSAGQALLPPAYRRQAGMTKWEKFIASHVQ